MYLSRTGAKRDHGSRYVLLPAPVIEWSEDEASVKIRHGEAKDFYDEVSHTYSINVELTEVLKIFTVLAEAAMKNPEFFQSKLGPILASLLQLQAVAAGLARH